MDWLLLPLSASPHHHIEPWAYWYARSMVWGWGALLPVGVLAAWRWRRQGRWVDTYQAIWGPDPRHPGNRIKPIGWGVHRPPSSPH